jgi:hypothetical protein
MSIIKTLKNLSYMFRSLNYHPQGALWSLLKLLSENLHICQTWLCGSIGSLVFSFFKELMNLCCRIAMFDIYEEFN